MNIDNMNARNYILIKGARLHNLKNIDLAIPRNKLVVVTGVSGSGKSSLVIDTLYAEGQRRYVESLSSYARQFLGRMNKPNVDYIKGICPAIAIEQKTVVKGARSTVGTLTELYDYLRLLFARIGKTYSPVSGVQVQKHDTADVLNYIKTLEQGTKIQIAAPINLKKQNAIEQWNLLLQNGFNRVLINQQMTDIETLVESKHQPNENDTIAILIDRLIYNPQDTDFESRCSDSIETAFYESNGYCSLIISTNNASNSNNSNSQTNNHQQIISFSNRFEADGITFEVPNQHFFHFNSPFGACPHCEGFGSRLNIDPNLVIPNTNLSVYANAIACWNTTTMQRWKNKLVNTAHLFNFPIHRPIKELTTEQYQLLWNGNEYFEGINHFFKHLEADIQKVQYRVLLSRYKGKTECQYCNGTRLRNESNYVKIDQKNIGQLLTMPIEQLNAFFKQLNIEQQQRNIAERILTEIENRLDVLNSVGLGYLTLNRHSSTLSGGETQRIHLTRMLGSNLTNAMYILDEPSVGLHPKDTQQMVRVLQQLRNLQNTVIVIEHEEAIMQAADYLIDIGPEAGTHGGQVVFAGIPETLKNATQSLTAQYLTQKINIHTPQKRRPVLNKITIHEATQHNLKNITVQFPLNLLTVVTGVSGSGKTTLVKQIFYPAVANKINPEAGLTAGKYADITGDLKQIREIELIDQNPIGRSSRSNPATYTKVYDDIRTLFTQQTTAKVRGYEPKHFSFNVSGGRCETCLGEGHVNIEMQFLADVQLICEDCNGHRFKNEVLEVFYKQKNIFDILEMTIEDAINFFADITEICNKLLPLHELGLGYIKLGQSSSTLSGGEAQRIKLATYLAKGKTTKPILFIFDEPSTGLHFHDIKKLLKAFNALIEIGHTVVVVEHNLDIIKSADWIIDLGPDAGDKGGNLVFQGTPEQLIHSQESYTAKFLKEKLP